VRLQVTPRETEVFVDGYLAGRVDDFDGTFQRLRLEPGGHELALYLEGHRTVRERVRLASGADVRVRHVMQPLAPGEPNEPRPEPTRPVPAAQPPTGTVQYEPPETTENRPPDAAGFGAVSIRVQPADAAVFIDGERWEGPRDDETLVVQVTPGTHRIEIRKEGYRSYTAEVGVTAAETAPVNISLPRQ